MAGDVLSMTGFGRGRREDDRVLIEIELRAVNGRFLDLITKFPREYAAFEGSARKLLSATLSRGRVEVSVRRTLKDAALAAVRFEQGLFDRYFETGMTAATARGVADENFRRDFTVSVLSRREVLDQSEPESDTTVEHGLLLEALNDALSGLMEMRRAEGAVLVADIRSRLAKVDLLRGEIEKLALAAPTQLREKILARLSQLAPEVQLDPLRLTTEAAIAADRVDVTEEITRLGSHLKQCGDALTEPPCGRKLDFLFQEVGRELSTIGAKAQEAALQHLVVDAKAELERAREQIANVE